LQVSVTNIEAKNTARASDSLRRVERLGF